jgi:thymidylate synthase
MDRQALRETIISLDLGTNCGWAVYDRGKVVFGTFKCKTTYFDSPDIRFRRFNEFLTDLFDQYRPQLVSYEAVRFHAGIQAAHVYGRMMDQVQEVCGRKSIPYEGVAEA